MAVQGTGGGSRLWGRLGDGVVTKNGESVPYYKAFRQLKGSHGSRRATGG